MADPRYLFVYGTLMRKAGTHAYGLAERRRLEAESTFVGEGVIRGGLVDLGDYPGLIEPEHAPRNARVFGELLQLHDADTTLVWLDQYEMISPADPEGSAYRRIPVTVTRATGPAVMAEVYAARNVPASARPLPQGRWR